VLSRFLRFLLPAKKTSAEHAPPITRYIDEKRAKAIRQAALFAETNGASGAPQCPRCGAEMALEMAPSGSRFWGCTEYPTCKATRKA
jgi:ssDNA-binding Zn-finger/Zn-ribbon topoisomerase 1